MRATWPNPSLEIATVSQLCGRSSLLQTDSIARPLQGEAVMNSWLQLYLLIWVRLRQPLNSAPPAPHEWLALRASQSD